MARRRTSRARSSLDASFQIPLAVNSTTNNLLLEDDALQDDFFDGFDYTLGLATPVPMKAQPSDSALNAQNGFQEPARSERKNFDYNYSQEEREMKLGSTDDDGQTPRGRRVGDSTHYALSPTPRSNRNRPGESNSVSGSPTTARRTPVRYEVVLTKRKEHITQSSPAKGQLLSSISPSVTPKPKQRRPKPSRASLSTQSTPMGALSVPSSSSRSSEPRLGAKSDDADNTMSCHEHAVPMRNSSAALTSATIQEDVTMPVSGGELTRDPRSPEKTSSKLTSASYAKCPTVSQRRKSRPRTRSTSPSGLSRIPYDSIMLPIQEEEEDWQARDEQSSISKPQQTSSSAVPRIGIINGGKEVTECDKDQANVEPYGNRTGSPLSSLTTGSSASKSNRVSRRTLAKRRGDSLDTQPVPKRRKRDLNTAHPDSIEESVLRPPATGLIPADSGPPPLPKELPTGEAQAPTISPTLKPVAPESNFRPSSPPPTSNPLIESRSDIPLEGTEAGKAPPLSDEGRDEVQDFLSHYAKKYGLAPDGASTAYSDVPIPSIVLEKDGVAPLKLSRTDATSETAIPKGKRPSSKLEHPPARSDPKDKAKYRDTMRKIVVRQASAAGNRVFNPRPTSGTDIGIWKKAGSSASVASSALPPASQAPGSVNTDIDIQVPQPHSASLIAQGTEVLPDDDEPVGPTAREALLDGTPRVRGLVTEENQTDGLRVSKAPSPASGRSEQSVAPEHVVPPDPKVFEALTVPAGPAEHIAETVLGPRRIRSADGNTPKSRPVPSALHPSKKKNNSEPHSDDMFARKKRDNYLQKGIDLTAHSRRRSTNPSATAAQNRPSRVSTQNILWRKKQGNAGPLADKPACLETVAGPSRSVSTVLDLTSDAGDQKVAAQRASSDAEVIVPSEGKVLHASRRDESSRDCNKKFVKPDSKPFRKYQERVASSSGPDRGPVQREMGSIPEPGEDCDISSNHIADRIVHFGQKIIDSLGLLSSQSNADATECSKGTKASHVSNLERNGKVLDRTVGPGIQQDRPAEHGATLSPREDEADGQDFSSGGTPSIDPTESKNQHQHQGAGDVHDIDHAGDLRSPFAFTGMASASTVDKELPSNSHKRGVGRDAEDTVESGNRYSQLSTEGRAQKRIRLTREGAFAAGTLVSSDSKNSRSEKSRGTITKRGTASRAGTRRLPASKEAKATKLRTATRDAELDGPSKISGGSGKVGPTKVSCALTVPVAPAFTTDVLRQRRLVSRSEREPIQHETTGEGKACNPKPGDRSAWKGAGMGGPASDTQTREPWKPTVPHAFRFETDTRLANRRQDFEAKLKTWEQRATAETRSSGQSTTGKKVPDFKHIHVAQQVGLANRAAQRREMIAPTKPVSPHLVVNARLAERHKFEETRRAKEKEAERIMEEQHRAREGEEEREWREARRRAIPRANQVPDWYAQAPKRATRSR